MRHHSNQLLYALDAMNVAELQVECTHKILLAIPALSNGVLSHLAKVDEHMHWLVWSKHRQEQSHLFLISSQLHAGCLEGLCPLFVCP